jgi:hypothetical protein
LEDIVKFLLTSFPKSFIIKLYSETQEMGAVCGIQELFFYLFR